MKSEGFKEWTKPEVETLLEEMNHIYNQGVLKNLTYRKRLLQRLKHVIKKYEKRLRRLFITTWGNPPQKPLSPRLEYYIPVLTISLKIWSLMQNQEE